MGNNKKRANIMVDSDLWEVAGQLLNCSRSEFINKQLRDYLGTINEIEVLEKEITNMEQELLAKKKKLKDLKEIKKRDSKNKDKIKKAYKTLERMHNKRKCVTIGEINNIANVNGVYKDVLIKECENNNFNIINRY